MFLEIYIYILARWQKRLKKKRSRSYNVSGLFHSIIYLSNKWLWRAGFFALLARASRGRSKLFVSLQLGLQIRMSLPAWRPMEPLFLSTGRLLYIIWKLVPLIASLCWAIHQSATATGAPCTFFFKSLRWCTDSKSHIKRKPKPTNVKRLSWKYGSAAYYFLNLMLCLCVFF